MKLFLIFSANFVFLLLDVCRSCAGRGAGRGKTRRSEVEKDGAGRNCAGRALETQCKYTYKYDYK